MGYYRDNEKNLNLMYSFEEQKRLTREWFEDKDTQKSLHLKLGTVGFWNAFSLCVFCWERLPESRESDKLADQNWFCDKQCENTYNLGVLR